MKNSILALITLAVSGFLANPVSAFTVVKDGDAYNFAKKVPTPTFNILYEKVGISKPNALFSKTTGSLFEAKVAEDANGNRAFGVQLPFSALPNHVNALYTLKKGDNQISGSYSFLFPDSVRDNYGNYYDLRISESNIKIGSREERGVRGTDHVTLFSPDRALVIRSSSGNYMARTGLGHQGDFTISVEKDDTPVEGSFIFSARDLDVPDHVTESLTNPNYAGPYSESFQDINNTIPKVYLTDDTTVRVIGGNRIVGSTSNIETTYKSGFAFLANATQTVHVGISGAATGVPFLLERSFSSFEQTSNEGGTIFATSRGDDYDSVSGRLITIPSAADGSNAVVYTMTPDSCHKAKSITLSTYETSGSETTSQIELANLTEHPVANLSFNETTGVLTYTYPNTDDHYRRHAIHVEWEEDANCSTNSTNPATNTDPPISSVTPTSSTNQTNLATPTTSEDKNTTTADEATNQEITPNTGAAANSDDSFGTTESFLGITIIGLLALIIIKLKRILSTGYSAVRRH